MKKIISLFLIVAMMLSVLPMAVFAEGNSGDIVLPPDCFHKLTYTNNGDDHTVSCAYCDYSVTEAHNFVNGTCICGATEAPAGPIYDSSLVFANYSFTMGSSLNMVYQILGTVVNKYPTFRVVVTKENHAGDPIVQEFTKDNGMTALGGGARYRFAFDNIAAKEMNDTFSATIYAEDANGVEYVGETIELSIASYCIDIIRNPNTAAKRKSVPLCVDLLNYGAIAQTFFDYNTANLANATLTPAEAALGTQGDPVAVNNQVKDGNGIAFTSVAPVLGSKVTLKAVINLTNYTGDRNNLHYVVTDENGNELYRHELYLSGGKIYRIEFDDISASKMRQLINVTIYDANDVQVSETLTWSIESYVAQQMASATATETAKALVKAILVYGDSAATYLAN